MANNDTLDAIGKELKSNPPAILNATRRKFGVERAQKQRTAILLSKARQAGVKIPKPVTGSSTKSTNSGGY
jgi:hypothetical protein